MASRPKQRRFEVPVVKAVVVTVPATPTVDWIGRIEVKNSTAGVISLMLYLNDGTYSDPILPGIGATSFEMPAGSLLVVNGKVLPSGYSIEAESTGLGLIGHVYFCEQDVIS